MKKKNEEKKWQRETNCNVSSIFRLLLFKKKKSFENHARETREF